METTEIIREPHRLTRPKNDRWLGGVATGLGQYFDLSPTIYRIAFVALALAGGTGVLLYAAAWLVIPEEGATESIASAELQKHRDRPRRLVGLAVLAFVAILALSEAHVWPSPGNLTLILVLGVGAIAWWRLGPAAPGRRRALVVGVLAIVAALLAALLVTVRVPLFSGVGSRLEQPANVQEIQSQYSLGIGHLRVDLSNVKLPKGETFVKARLGIGDLVVEVPQNAAVRVDGRAQIGDVAMLDRVSKGTRVHAHVVEFTGSGRVLVLDLRTGIGNVRVIRG